MKHIKTFEDLTYSARQPLAYDVEKELMDVEEEELDKEAKSLASKIDAPEIGDIDELKSQIELLSDMIKYGEFEKATIQAAAFKRKNYEFLQEPEAQKLWFKYMKDVWHPALNKLSTVEQNEISKKVQKFLVNFSPKSLIADRGTDSIYRAEPSRKPEEVEQDVKGLDDLKAAYDDLKKLVDSGANIDEVGEQAAQIKNQFSEVLKSSAGQKVRLEFLKNVWYPAYHK